MDNSVTTYEWSTTFTPKEWRLPAYKNYNYPSGEFRDVMIVWKDFMKEAASKPKPPMWSLYCDVLRLDADIVLDRTTLIFARRIELAGAISLIIDKTKIADIDFILYSQEIINYKTGKTAVLNIVTVDEDDTERTVQMTSATDGANGLNWADGKEPVTGSAVTVPLDKGFLLEGEPLRLLLNTTFQIATLLCTNEHDLSLAQLHWIQRIAAASMETIDLSIQAGAMANNLLLQRTAGDNSILVPFLDSSVYAESASNMMTLLRMRDDKWTNVQNLKRTDQNWREVVMDSLGDKADQKNLSTQLQRQAEQALDQAIQARSIAAKMIIEAKSSLDARRIWFEQVGIPDWQRKETMSAAIDMVMGFVDILKQIPAIVAGGPEFAVMPIVEAGASLVSGVADFIISPTKEPPVFGPLTKDETAAKKRHEKETAERKAAGAKLQDSIVKAGEGGKKVIDAAMKIAKIAAQAAAMEASSTKILGAIGTTVDEGFASVSVAGLDVATGGSQEWDLLELEINQAFSEITPLENIEGGTEYRLEFRKLIVKGKALCMARLAVAKATAQYAEMKIRTLTAEKSLKRTEERMKKLDVQIQDDESMIQYAFNKVMDAKRSVYLAIESYQRAFMYFTLADKVDTPILPRLLDSVDDFQKAVSKIAGKELTLAQAFSGAKPQTMKKEIVLKDTATMRQLRDNGYFTWALKFDDELFKTNARVRFTKVNVFVGFMDGYSYDKEISVRILSSGHYSDKNLRKNEKQFLGPATHLNFEYTERGGNRSISLDGDIDPRYANDFFNPTPFTTWTFSFNNDDIDRSKIEKMTIHFAGNALSI